jgi:hypothetical protein
LIGVTGRATTNINSNTYLDVLYTDNVGHVTVTCLNSNLGNVNQTYDVGPYGLNVQWHNMMIPMNFLEWNIGSSYFTNISLAQHVNMVNGTNFSVDSNYGKGDKRNYGLTFTHDISDFNAAANKAGTNCCTKWRRTA